MIVSQPFPKAPIVEAVIDIYCALRPGFDVVALEAQASGVFRDRYPEIRKQYTQEFEIGGNGGAVEKVSARSAIQALQFCQIDEQQLVQLRSQGFSFNRLAPYSTLDDYLPEIKRTWQLYAGLAAPVETQLVRLRYINRILLPMPSGQVDLDEYLTIAPRVADDQVIQLTGFFIQHAGVEKDTGHQVNLVLTAQPIETDKLPIILDIGVASPLREEPSDWPAIRQTIDSLRNLKNRLLLNTVTDKCQQLFH